MQHRLLTSDELPQGFSYPGQLKRLAEIEALEFQPWTILTGEKLREKFQGLKARYPQRSLVPIAARQDYDDVACFDLNAGNVICIIHDYASAGWEQSNKKTYSTFHQWLRDAFEDFLMWGDGEADVY